MLPREPNDEDPTVELVGKAQDDYSSEELTNEDKMIRPPYSLSHKILSQKINIYLVFKFYPTMSVLLYYNEVHLVKAISNNKKKLYRETQGDNQILK